MNDEKIEVAQVDREAAWKHAPKCYLNDESGETHKRWMAGAYDEAASVIKDFARHRLETVTRTAVACAENCDRLSTPTPNVAALVEALRKAIGWFDSYEHQHRAKLSSEGNMKADTNAERAAFLRAALAPFQPKQEGGSCPMPKVIRDRPWPNYKDGQEGGE